MNRIQVSRIDKHVPLPKKAYAEDAAYDLYATREVTLKPLETGFVPTGIKIALPDNHVGIIKDRSGIASKTPLQVKAGVIDSGFRGEWKIIMTNVGKNSYTIEKYTRIAQFLVVPIAVADIIEVEELEKQVERGEKAFGSSGIQ